MSSSDDAVRDHFFAEIYEATTAPFISPASTAKDVDQFLALASPPAQARVLDLGCGWGRHMTLLKARGYNVMGIERSQSLAAKAQAACPDTVIQADLRALPLSSASFDAVACFYSSVFLFDEEENHKALAEVARVLKPGGAFMLQTANPMHLRRLGGQEQAVKLPDGSEVFEFAEFDPQAGREKGYRRLTKASGEKIEGLFSVRYYAPGELEVLGRRVGLRLERVCGDNGLWPFTRDSRDLVALFRKPLTTAA
jgi:SAM-dependent methyltransferase